MSVPYPLTLRSLPFSTHNPNRKHLCILVNIEFDDVFCVRKLTEKELILQNRLYTKLLAPMRWMICVLVPTPAYIREIEAMEE